MDGTMLDLKPPAGAVSLETLAASDALADQVDWGPLLDTPTDPLPVAPQPVRRPRHHWGRAAKHLFKAALLLAEVPIIVLLAGYAGIWHALPATPPGTLVASDGQPHAAATGPYCWLVPGNALCSDTSPAPSALPLLTVSQGSALSFAFQSPPPTDCGASAAALAPSSAAEQIAGPLTGPLASAHGRTQFRLLVGLAPGMYRLDLSCQWDAPPLLRWLQGEGTASYAVLVRVLPVSRSAHRIAA